MPNLVNCEKPFDVTWSKNLKQQLEALKTPEEKATQGAAAVLVVIGHNEKTNQSEILLTKRTQTVETHKGQVSFPGGFWEDGDKDFLETAIRECEEEVGLGSEQLNVLGPLSEVLTRGSVRIYPWVAETKFPCELTMNPHEVERVLYLPVDRLLNEGLQTVTVPVENMHVKSSGIWVDDELVWGATARVLEELVLLLSKLKP